MRIFAKWKVTITWKKFREITVEDEINFLSKSNVVKVEFQKFQTAAHTVWIFRKFTLTLFWQKFRESNTSTKEITK